MAFQLNQKLLTMTPYDPIEGEYPIRLDANESFLQPDEAMRQAFQDAVRKVDFNRYPDPYAKMACQRFAQYYGVAPELVTAGDGSDELISILMNAFLQKGDKVLTLAPDFSMYRFYTSVVECPCVTLEKNKDFTIPVSKVIEALNKEKIRMLVFSNPCNPTSVGLSADGVREILRGTDALVVLDEAYMDFWDQSLLSEVEQYDNLVILRTCSKALGMAAIRLGFAVASRTLTDAIRAVKSPYNVNTVTQAMACALFSRPSYLDACREEVIKSRDMLYKMIKEVELMHRASIEVTPTVTNFLFIKTVRAPSVFERLKQAGIVVRLMGDYLRVSAGSKTENEQFTATFQSILEEAEKS